MSDRDSSAESIIVDPKLDPRSWKKLRKWYLSILLAMLQFNISSTGSVFVPAIPQMQAEWGANPTLVLAGITVYSCCFSIGPPIFAPISETIGRRPIYVFCCLVFTATLIPTSFAQNVNVFLILRTISGLAGAGAFAIVGGSLADLWTPTERAQAMSFFAATTLAGPCMGPVLGSLIVDHLHWRWTIHVQSISAGVLLLLILFTVPETYAPKLAQREIKHDVDTDRPSLMKRIGVALQRPFRMLFFEPIVLSLAIYVAFMYGVIFLFLLIIPLTFSHHRNADTLTSNLPLLSFTAGFILYLPIVPFVNRIYRARPYPETRLLSVIVAAIVFPISLFWWAWTAPYASIHWIIPTLAGVPFAMASLAVWLGICDYLVDLYDNVGWGASALAANTVLRSSFAGCFPLFGNAMYNTLGTQGLGSLLGAISLAMLPIPMLLYRYGRTTGDKSGKWKSEGETDKEKATGEVIENGAV